LAECWLKGALTMSYPIEGFEARLISSLYQSTAHFVAVCQVALSKQG
jgi:hypothetical protein